MLKITFSNSTFSTKISDLTKNDFLKLNPAQNDYNFNNFWDTRSYKKNDFF